MGICVLCGQNKRLTNEHIWSNGLLRVFDAVAPLTIDSKRAVVHRGDPLIKDICDECNQGMSLCDGYITDFARQYLTKELPREPVILDRDMLLWWVIKTSANLSRGNKNDTGWWRRHISFIKNGIDPPDIDLFAAPWYEKRPSLIQHMMPVNTIDARGLVLHVLTNPSWEEISAYFEAGWALKVGAAVFAFIDWNEGVPSNLRNRTCDLIRAYGWSLVGRDVFPKRTPFNDITCFTYYVISDPANNNQLNRLK